MRSGELAFLIAWRSPAVDQLALGVYAQHLTGTVTVGHIDVAGGCDGDIAGMVERCVRPVPPADAANALALWVEDHHLMRVAVDNIQPVVRTDRQHVPVGDDALAPGGDAPAVGIKLDDHRQLGIDVAVGAQQHEQMTAGVANYIRDLATAFGDVAPGSVDAVALFAERHV